MRKLILSLISIAALLVMAAGMADAQDQGFLRYPDVYGDKVVFSSEGDLWIAPLEEGIARRLTTHDGEERYGKFSNHGKWIAYSAHYEGNLDVYVIPAEGGEPKRLTFHPGSDNVSGWTPQGRIMYRSVSFNGLYDYQLFTVSREGDYSQSLGLDKAALASFSPEGNKVAYTRIFRNNATWKHYKGGLADQIWVADLKSKKFGKAPISTYTGHNSYPMWIGDRIYFISDSTGRKNIWSMNPEGGDQRQHTFHKDYDARWPSEGTGFIVYQVAMDIWKFEVSTGKYLKINIKLPSERLRARTRIIDPSGYIDGWDLSADGKWIVIAARGQLFTAPTKSREAVIRRLTDSYSCRSKHPFFIEGKVIALTDKSGEDEFHLFDPFLKEKPKQISSGNKVWRYAGIPSPDGKWVAFSDGNLDLWLMEAETGKTLKVTQSEVWEIRNYEWSPDSRYLAYTGWINWDILSVNIYDVEKKKDHLISNPMYSCYSPSWDPKGKYLYYAGTTNFNALRGFYGAQFVYYQPDKLYMTLLNKEAENPFAPEKELLERPKDENKEEEKDKDKDKDKGKDEKKKDEEAEKEEEKLEVKIDWEGIETRVIEIPVDPGYYWGLTGAEEMLYYLSWQPTGTMSGDDEDDKASLNLYNFDKRKNYTVAGGIDGYDVSDDRKIVVAQMDSRFIRMEAGATELPKGEGDDDPAVKLSGWSVKLEPRDEWKQMFYEAWRIQRDFFYDEKMHGVDWPQVYEHYKPLIDRISTRAELNDLIGEMIGELNAGHAYIFGGDIHQPRQISVGLLGADISRHSSGYFRIDKIFASDKTHDKWVSPLAEPSVGAKEGDYIIAIDGVPTNSVSDYLELLQDKAGKQVILTLNSKPTDKEARDVLVEPVGGEYSMRYRDWVEGRRKYVEEKSGGKIGYVHMSDMMSQGLWQFGQQFYPQVNNPGMILDVRHNGGGNVATMLLAQLNREVWSIGRPRHGGTYTRPSSAFSGHYAIVCDAETGSDGETFTKGAQMLGLGKVFGKRTWGGWVGIRSDKPLNDRVWFTSPEFSGWGAIGDDKGQWLIEGPGVYPDVEVENDPGSVLAGKDPQLDAAIEHLLKEIKDNPKKLPEEPPIPFKESNFPKR